MATLADSLVSSSARRLPMRKRPDLSAKQQRYQGKSYWVVKEPVGLHYFRFQEEEYAILNMLDGEASLDSIKDDFEEKFPPQKITVEELGQFIGMLHRSNLVIADVAGQGIQLKKRRDKRKRQELLAALSNILALRFKGIDPDRILTWLHPKFKWMFTKTALFFCMLLALSALTLVAVQFDTFRTKLPTFHQFFLAENWIWLGLVLAVTKIIHEFGHGLSCKHFGGECHEMGMMLLVLTPCLYCNVSDSWMLPNKWHRAIIGAAGMYIEVCMASIATFIWWFSSPGLLNQICLSTMFVCSVSTIIFNANPLLRYDGYYILSDLTEIPNLRQKATTILTNKLNLWCLGIEEPDDAFLPEKNQLFFAGYSIAAAVYRWVVLFSILLFMYNLLEPYGLKVISQMLALMSVAGLIGQPLWKVGKFFYIPGRSDKIKRKNVQITAAIAAAAIGFLLFVPLPYRVMCALEVKPRDAEPVYVEVTGKLEELMVKPRQVVTQGQPLAKLSNTDIELSITELEGKQREYDARLLSMRRLRGFDMQADVEIPQIMESLETVQRQLEVKRHDLARLNLNAPIAGTVFSPPEQPARNEGTGQLPTWSGTPLRQRNLGAVLQESTLFCQIGNPAEMEAILIVEQDDVEFLRAGQELDIKLDELPHRTFHSTINEVASIDLKVSPKSLSSKAGGDIITKTDETGVERPMNTSYQARAALDDPDKLLHVGLRGRAKVHTQWQTLWTRGWRYLTRTFNFKM